MRWIPEHRTNRSVFRKRLKLPALQSDDRRLSTGGEGDRQTNCSKIPPTERLNLKSGWIGFRSFGFCFRFMCMIDNNNRFMAIIYRSTCVSRHPQLRSESFCCLAKFYTASVPLLTATSAFELSRGSIREYILYILWFDVKIKRILGLHGTTSEMK